MQKSKTEKGNSLYKVFGNPDYKELLKEDHLLDTEVMAMEKLSKTTLAFYFIIDVNHQRYSYVSHSVKSLTGYTRQECMEKGIRFSMDICHEEDRKILHDMYRVIHEWLAEVPPSMRPSCEFINNFRLLHADGRIITILRNLRFLQFDELGKPSLILGVCQDITPFKTDHTIVLNMNWFNDADRSMYSKSKTFLPVRESFQLSERELEVLHCLHKGMSNGQITDKLFISLNTVKSHRKNMLVKSGCHTIQELIYRAEQMGLIVPNENE